MRSQLPPILFQGSVKNVRGEHGQTPYIFEYSDRFSVFDWGEMPDLLDNKGQSLCYLANLIFEQLANPSRWQQQQNQLHTNFPAVLEEFLRHGPIHHCLGAVDHQLQPTATPTSYLAVRPVAIHHPPFLYGNWDYSLYAKGPTNCLVPLEVIFRFGVPEGSSLVSRGSDPQYSQEIGLSGRPQIGDLFERPIIEFSTKLEAADRYLNYRQAQQLAGLSDYEFQLLREKTSLIAQMLRLIFAQAEIELWDGKLEFAFIPGTGQNGNSHTRDFMLVDAIGPDELRLIYQNTQLSKEGLRWFYRQGPWATNVQKAKFLAQGRGISDWKKICVEELKSSPPHLPLLLKNAIEEMYQALANQLAQICQRSLPFPHIPDLSNVAKKIRENFQ